MHAAYCNLLLISQHHELLITFLVNENKTKEKCRTCRCNKFVTIFFNMFGVKRLDVLFS
jgi:hypothetical protein